MKQLLLLCLLLLTACAARRPYTVLPGKPYYRMQAPDRTVVSFPDTLNQLGNTAEGWVDLAEGMALRIEQAYYQEGAAKRDISSFLGLESQSFTATREGRLRALPVQTLPNRPVSQPSVQFLVPSATQQYARHRLYFQVVVHPASGTSTAVLLSSNSKAELDGMSDPAETCRRAPARCIVFPPGCSVSLGVEVSINGKTTVVLWGNSVARTVGKQKVFTLQRRYKGSFRNVILDASDTDALRLPLLPGDRLRWPL